MLVIGVSRRWRKYSTCPNTILLLKKYIYTCACAFLFYSRLTFAVADNLWEASYISSEDLRPIRSPEHFSPNRSNKASRDWKREIEGRTSGCDNNNNSSNDRRKRRRRSIVVRSAELNYPDVAAQIRLPVYAHNALRNVQSTSNHPRPLPTPSSFTSIAITPGGRGRNLCTYVCSLCTQRLGTYWPIRTAGSKINSPLCVCYPLSSYSPLCFSFHSVSTLLAPTRRLLRPRSSTSF